MQVAHRANAGALDHVRSSRRAVSVEEHLPVLKESWGRPGMRVQRRRLPYLRTVQRLPLDAESSSGRQSPRNNKAPNRVNVDEVRIEDIVALIAKRETIRRIERFDKPEALEERSIRILVIRNKMRSSNADVRLAAEHTPCAISPENTNSKAVLCRR